jgi:L-malate glycosyltransferase
MKIFFLAGANSIHSYRWIKYFADKGHEICWISLAPLTAGEAVRNISFYEIPQFPIKILSIFKAIIRTRKLIKEIKPEVLHAHYAGIYGLIGALSEFHPLIVTAWGSDILISAKSKVQGLFIKFILSKADLITCDGENTRAAMINLGVRTQKIKTIFFGVDIKKFKPGQQNEKLKKKLAVSYSPIVIFLRGSNPGYDAQTLIKAIPIILLKIPNTKFIIAGGGEKGDYLINLAKSLKIIGATRFIGQIPNEELPQYLNLADVYVCTSLSDGGISISTAEGMACGLPVVVTDSGDNKKWIEDGKGGFVIPKKNHRILAEKVIYLLKNRKVGLKFGKINREIIEAKNNYYKEMQKMENIYTKLFEK